MTALDAFDAIAYAVTTALAVVGLIVLAAIAYWRWTGRP